MSRTNSHRPEVVAYHEAGHAIMACLYQRPIKRVSIVGEDGAAGFLEEDTGRRVRTWNDLSTAETPEERYDLEGAIVSVLAGPASEKVHFGRHSKWGASGDVDEAWHLARVRSVEWDDAECRAYYRWANLHALNLLRTLELYNAVELLADLLLRHGEVGEAEVKACIEATRLPQAEKG